MSQTLTLENRPTAVNHEEENNVLSLFFGYRRRRSCWPLWSRRGWRPSPPVTPLVSNFSVLIQKKSSTERIREGDSLCHLLLLILRVGLFN
jgi:hypothetical protein